VQQLPTRAAFDLTLTTYTVDVKLKHDPIGDFFGTVGVSGMRQGNVGAGSSFLIPNFRLYSGGVYAIESWAHGDLTLDAGARFDYRWQKVYANPPHLLLDQTLTFSNISAAVGAIYQFGETWSANANLGMAFRPPSVNELYSYGVHHGTAEFEIGDPSLKTERSTSVDLTLKHRDSGSQAEVSIYNNSMQHFIFLFPNPVPVLTLRGAFPSFSYRQAAAVLRGIDASVEFRIVDGYRLGGGISLVRGDNLDTGEPLYQMPADRFRITNKFELPSTDTFRKPFAELNGTFVRRQDRYPPKVDYVDPPPGYATFDCSFGADLMMGQLPVSLSFSVRNLLNSSYREYLSRFRYYIDDPGRDFVLRAQLPFADFNQ
jgi:iron complex outermembrane receptor protein